MRIRAVAGWAFLAMLCMFASACSNNGLDPNLPAITTQPVDATAKAGSTATFTVVATGQAPLSYQWFVFAKPIKGATSSSYTTAALAASDNNSFYYVLVTNSIGSIESDEVLLTVTSSSAATVSANTLGNANPSDVLTSHNDAARTGQYLGETLLTPTNVSAAKFGKLGTLMTDGQVDAQPLYASGVTLPSGDVRNVLYAATEHGTVYAFDAVSGSVIWQAGLNGANEQAADSGSCTTAPQERGITATPVVDRTRGPHGAIYVIANTKDSTGTVIQRIHALDIATGAELFSGPTLIHAYASAANAVASSAQQNFDAAQYQPLSGLQLVNGKVYAAFGPTCATAADSGWVIGFDPEHLKSAGSVFLAPSLIPGATGFVLKGLASDSVGNFYAFGGGDFISQTPSANGFPVSAFAGDSFLRFSTENGLALAELPAAAAAANSTLVADAGGISSVVVLPDLIDAAGNTSHLALGAGGDGSVYLLNRDYLIGGATKLSPIVQVISEKPTAGGATTDFTYFNDVVYSAQSGGAAKAFTVSDARLSTSPASQSSKAFGASGAQISISANGANGGILWAIENGAGILHAYDAANLTQEIYNSTQAANSRDVLTTTVSAVSPTIAGGRVFIATKNGIVVFGQLK
jgi:PQQ enzyme repeat